MKYLYLLCLCLLGAKAAAQSSALPLDSVRGKVAYTAVVQVPGATQAELFGRALKWLATLPVNPSDPTVKDAASGTLAARVGIPFQVSSGMLKLPYTLWREVSVQVKDGRAKYDISDFAIQRYVADPTRPSLVPSKSDLEIRPFEQYLTKSDWHNYTKDGQPRVITAGFLGAVRDQSASQIKSLTAALQAKSDF